MTSREAIRLEENYGAHNYSPLPVVIARGEGVYVWDVEGKKYYDFLSAYSALNQGHCHPRLVNALIAQAHNLTLTSRAFFNDILGAFEKKITGYFGYQKVLPMNTGAEAVETALKICRKWAYEVKGVEQEKATIIACTNNFHGRTTTIISFSSEPESKNNFGPYTPGFVIIPFDDLTALEMALENRNVAGFLVEPVQGEAGAITPSPDYLAKAWELCRKANVLFIADEIQTGFGRTGSLLGMCGDCSCQGHCERQTSYRKPDILILGKALTGGFYPVSAVLADNPVMDVIKPGQHGSTFGGNPLGCRVAIEALEIIKDERLPQNAREMGKIFRERMERLRGKTSLISLVRGKGLMNALVINDSPERRTAWNISLDMMQNGLLAKPTHGNIIRLAPPLIINEEQIHECCDIIEKTFLAFK
ncbi:MAG TPA: ornithine--oxo-acid transaminase [Cyclobacteriaceae bacterium]|nr:ornithine--oxo-acid transaminase [Cyclobacteriaceae bacterium]